MAEIVGKKLSAATIPVKSVLTGSEQIYINDAGVSKKTTPDSLKNYSGYPYSTMQDPTGFVSPELVVITGLGDNTIQLTGTVEVLWQGFTVAELVADYISPAHGTDTAQNYYLSYNGTTIAWNTTVWSFSDVQICVARYDATNAVWYYVRECHGLMGWREHEHFHDTIGTVLDAGGTIPAASYTLNSTTAANRRPNIDQTIVADEDLKSTLAAWTGAAYTQFRLGTAGADVNTLAAADIISLSTNNPYFNSPVP